MKGWPTAALTAMRDLQVLPLAALCPLRAALPVRLRQHDWRLAFSTDQHGCSLQTLYRRLASRGPSLLVVLDADGSVFGGFASESWRADASHYFGTGERPPPVTAARRPSTRPLPPAPPRGGGSGHGTTDSTDQGYLAPVMDATSELGHAAAARPRPPPGLRAA